MEPFFVRKLVVGPVQANCYLAGPAKGEESLVIDPGADAQAILALVKECGRRVTAIVNTHAHFDHAGANRELRRATGAPIVIHRRDADMLPRLAAQALFFLLRVENSPPADRLVEEGDTVAAGDLILTVRHTPGHTPGGICLVGPGMVFSGDTLFAGSIGRTDLPGGCGGSLLASLRQRLLTLPDDTVVYPGHGPNTTIGAERAENPFLQGPIQL